MASGEKEKLNKAVKTIGDLKYVSQGHYIGTTGLFRIHNAHKRERRREMGGGGGGGGRGEGPNGISLSLSPLVWARAGGKKKKKKSIHAYLSPITTLVKTDACF